MTESESPQEDLQPQGGASAASDSRGEVRDAFGSEPGSGPASGAASGRAAERVRESNSARHENRGAGSSKPARADTERGGSMSSRPAAAQTGKGRRPRRSRKKAEGDAAERGSGKRRGSAAPAQATDGKKLRHTRSDRSDRKGFQKPIVIPADDVPRELVHQDAMRVISRLSRAGFEAYLVGGCVRDLLLGRKPKDFDVATAAHPRQIKRLFRNGRIIGRRFKLVHVIYGRHIIETSTFRREPPNQAVGEDLLITDDNAFGTAGEDASRRDFTINGLFLEPSEGRIIDFVGGLEDLERGVLRTIGDPSVRMAEDPVRILRAIKFATRLGFRISDSTWEAMCQQAGDLERSAPPRVLEEILRLLRSGTCLGAFRMMRACGALSVLLPVLDNYLGKREDSDPAAHDRADNFWRLIEALDADVHDGHKVSSALCIAATFLRVIEREADPETRTLPGAPRDLFSVSGEVLIPVAQATRLPRRDLARARRIIANQRRFTQKGGKRFKPLLFMFSEEFEDSLRLFRLRSAAWGQGWDVYEGWVERYRLAKQVSASELEEARRKRRRRRRPSKAKKSKDAPQPGSDD